MWDKQKHAVRGTGRELDRKGSRSGFSPCLAGQVQSLLGYTSCPTGEVGLLVNGCNARLPMQRQMLGGCWEDTHRRPRPLES